MNRIVVVGASLAGLTAAQTLRRQGYHGALALIGDEAHYPYDRPPLSKDYLAGTADGDRIRLRAAADPDELGIEWMLGHRAVGLDPEAAQVTVEPVTGGPSRPVAYDGLVVATGARARGLPAGDGVGPPSGVQVLRTRDDADQIRARFEAGPGRVVVVGAGFIGAEVAATARQAGLEVTMVEMADVPMGRVLDPEAGMAVAELHRSHGVDVRLGTGIEALVGQPDLTGVRLTDGTSLDARVAVVGIGAIPNTGWLEGSGLTLDDGVVADETALAAPGIVVAGDVARWPNRRFGGLPMRVEQWDNAVEMGGYAAKRLLAWAEGGEVEPYQPVPWFWSDQYDRKIQLAGMVSDRAEVVQGSFDEQRFVQIYLDGDDRMVGALCWNRPRQAIMARTLIADGAGRDDAAGKLG